MEKELYYKASILEPDPNQPCECGACDWKGTFKELNPIKEATLTPGDDSPAGRCPAQHCGALAYVV